MKLIKNIPVAAMAVLSSCAMLPQTEKEASFIAASYNVRRANFDASPNTWSERCPRCREIIRRNQMDLIGLQEPLIDQIKSLFADTKYKVIGGGRNDFREDGEFSCIAYNSERFECLKNGTFGLSEKPDQPGYRSWNSNCPRIATWGLFRDRKTGKEFIYYNTHLDNKSELARCKGIEMIVEHAKKNAAGKPLMLSGDFNTTPGTETYRTAQSLLRDTGVVSETPHEGPGNTFQRWGTSPNRTQPIDYIFVSSDFRVLSHRTDNTLIDGKYPSDHFPVVTRLLLK